MSAGASDLAKRPTREDVNEIVKALPGFVEHLRCDPPQSCAYCDRAQLRAALKWIEKQPGGEALVRKAFSETTHSVKP